MRRPPPRALVSALVSALVPVLAALAALALAPGAASAAAAAPVILRYNESPPLQVTAANGSISGVVATPALRAFADAGVAYRIIATPVRRQMVILQANEEASCMLGWRSTPARERIGQFTEVVYPGSVTGALARADNDAVRSGAPLAGTLKNPALRALLKEGTSYGDSVDAALAADPPRLVSTTTDRANMLRMLLARRADYMFIAADEAEAILADPAFVMDRKAFKFVAFSDVTDGAGLSLWCTRRVPAAVMERLNGAIRHGAPR